LAYALALGRRTRSRFPAGLERFALARFLVFLAIFVLRSLKRFLMVISSALGATICGNRLAPLRQLRLFEGNQS
jgi:hypothetical protein